jgi:hypothetical protein
MNVLQHHVPGNVLELLKDFVIEAHLHLVLVPVRFIVLGHRFTSAFACDRAGLCGGFTSWLIARTMRTRGDLSAVSSSALNAFSALIK